MAEAPRGRRPKDRAAGTPTQGRDPGRRNRLGSALVGLGALLLLAVAAQTVDALITRARVLERLAELQSGPAHGAGLARKEADSTGMVGRIESPRIGLDAAVLEGMGTLPLMRGVGHDPASAFPGESGNAVLAGHRDTHFRALRDIRVGDPIEVSTADGAFAYRVDTILIVGPERTDLLRDGGREQLTLVTCYPFHWIGPAPQRLVVRAAPEAQRPAMQDASGGSRPDQRGG